MFTISLLLVIVGAASFGFVLATMLASGAYDRGWHDGQRSLMQAHPVAPEAISAWLDGHPAHLDTDPLYVAADR